VSRLITGSVLHRGVRFDGSLSPVVGRHRARRRAVTPARSPPDRLQRAPAELRHQGDGHGACDPLHYLPTGARVPRTGGAGGDVVKVLISRPKNVPSKISRHLQDFSILIGDEHALQSRRRREGNRSHIAGHAYRTPVIRTCPWSRPVLAPELLLPCAAPFSLDTSGAPVREGSASRRHHQRFRWPFYRTALASDRRRQ
jgi:hypothetical protein